MANQIHLIPGHPLIEGDGNHRNAPGDILNIKGFYDQDSHIMPDSLLECEAELVDGQTNHWVEYVPTGYDGSKPVPLVISQHGGGQSGWGQCYATSWYLVAEREGFIAVFPDAPARREVQEQRSNVGQTFYDDNNTMLNNLIATIRGKYNIDAERIYMQGMSMGDLETCNYARYVGTPLAGGGCTAGPNPVDKMLDANGEPFDYVCPVPMYQARGTNDNMSIDPRFTRWDNNRANRVFWMKINGCNSLPLIGMDSGECIAYWRGEKADVAYRDVYERGHGQTIDCAERAWDLLFSHTRRLPDGSCDCGEIPAFADHNAVALASGSSWAYVDNHKVPMGGEAKEITVSTQVPDFMLRGERPGPGTDMSQVKMVEKILAKHIYVPLTFLETAFGAKIEQVQGETAVFTVAGRRVEIAHGNTAAIVDNHVERMWRFAEWIDGVPYIGIAWVAEKLLHRFTTMLDGVMYINDKPSQLTPDFVNILREILD